MFGASTVTVSDDVQSTPIVDKVIVAPDAITLNKGDLFTLSAIVTGANAPSQNAVW